MCNTCGINCITGFSDNKKTFAMTETLVSLSHSAAFGQIIRYILLCFRKGRRVRVTVYTSLF